MEILIKVVDREEIGSTTRDIPIDQFKASLFPLQNIIIKEINLSFDRIEIVPIPKGSIIRFAAIKIINPVTLKRTIINFNSNSNKITALGIGTQNDPDQLINLPLINLNDNQKLSKVLLVPISEPTMIYLTGITKDNISSTIPNQIKSGLVEVAIIFDQ